MGVLACDRKGCTNIMCDRHSDEYGYICNECFNELLDKVRYVAIDTFMNTPKKSFVDNYIEHERRTIINNTFKLRD